MSEDRLGRIYADGDVIVRQGEVGDCMFAILEGRVEIVQETRGGDVRVAIMGKGDIFGEIAIFENEVRSATVRALGEARLLTIDKRTFLRRVQEDPSLAFKLVRTMCRRIRELSAELAALRREPALNADDQAVRGAAGAGTGRPPADER